MAKSLTHSYPLKPWYSLNIAKVGIKHQSINQSIIDQSYPFFTQENVKSVPIWIKGNFNCVHMIFVSAYI
jgi:hypothetical protein